MFYCDPCAEKNDYPRTMFRSHGRCECCGNTAVCNERASKDLPAPRRRVDENGNVL